MTEVSFHFNMPDRLSYVCRLLRKATRQGARVVVAGPSAALSTLDRSLWTFDPLEFIAHLRLAPGNVPAPRLLETPVWLVEQASDGPCRDVLLNLGAEPPVGFESYQRVIEIVSTDEDDRASGRLRWKHYANRGYAIQRHEVTS